MENNDLMNLLNKIFTGIVVIIVLLALNTILMFVSINNKTVTNNDTQVDEEEVITEYDVSKFTEIKSSEIKEKTTDKVSVVYIGRSTCSWCVKFVPVLTDATVKNDLNTLYIDISKIIDFTTGQMSDQAAYDAMLGLDAVDEFKTYIKDNFGATPMTIVIKDGKILAALTGYVDASGLDTFLKDNDLLK